MEFHPTKSMWMTTKTSDQEIELSNTILKQSSEYKYLGDILTSDGKISETITQRKNSIIGITAELNAITDELRQSTIHIDAVLQYHHGIIIPRLLLNCETWNTLTKQNYTDIESIQNTNLKRLLRLPASTPSAGLRNELGILSTRSQITKKRAMYLHRLLNLPQTNITQQILLEQQTMPGNTWLHNTLTELEELGLNISLDELKCKSKQQWKSTLTQAITQVDQNERQKWMQDSTKCKLIETLNKVAPYIHKLQPAEAWIILKTRLGMLNLKMNYKTAHTDTICPLCTTEPDTQEHLLKCHKLSQSLQIFDYTKIFSNSNADIPILEMMAQAINQKMKQRELLMEREEQSCTNRVPSLEDGQCIRQ